MVTNTIQDAPKVLKTEALKKIRSIKVKAKSFNRRKKTKSNDSMVYNITGQAYRTGKNVLASAYHSAGEVGSKVRRAMPGLPSALNKRGLNRSMQNVIEDRPVVLGVIGFGIGVALAAVIPMFSHQRNSRRR